MGRRGLATSCVVLILTSCAAGQVTLHRNGAVPADLDVRLRRAISAPAGPDASRIARVLRSVPEKETRGDTTVRRLEPSRPRGGGGMGGGTLGGLVGVGIIVLILGLLAWFVIRHRSRDARAQAQAEPSWDPRDAPQWMANGDRLLAEGRFAEALRAFYMHGFGELRDVQGLEGGTHLADARLLRAIDDEALRRPFEELSRLFQPVRYGGFDVDEEAVAAARKAALAIDAGMHGPARRARRAP